MTYKLDIVLNKVNIEPSYVIPGNKVWFNFNCDGCTQSATTPCVPMQAVANFGTPCQFIINTADKMGSYFYLTLCYYSATNEMIPLARARSRIGKLPLEAVNKKSFEIPLMSVANREQTKQIASALFSGTLSQINFSSQAPYMPSMPYQTQPQVQMPSYPCQCPSNGQYPAQQGSYGGAATSYQQQGSIPGYPQSGMIAPTPYSGAVPFGPMNSQGMPQQQYQYPQQAMNFPQQPGNIPQQPGYLPQQPGINQQQNQVGGSKIGDNQYYF